jgi:hypothetical protein
MALICYSAVVDIQFPVVVTAEPIQHLDGIPRCLDTIFAKALNCWNFVNKNLALGAII